MTTKQMLLSATLILGATANIASAMESKQTIEADAKKMLSICEDQCSFTKDVMQNCTSKCFMDYGKQKEHFLVRQYTTECQNLPFNENWSFKTDDKSKCINLINTNNAYMKRHNNPAVNNCVNMRLASLPQIMKDLEKEKNNEWKQAKKESPVITTFIEANNKIRGLEKK